MVIRQYEIQYQEEGTNTWITETSTPLQREWTHDGLSDDTTYLYRIRAANRLCVSEWSEVSSFTTGEVPLAPLAPRVQIQDLNNGQLPQVRLSWQLTSASTEIVSSYTILIGNVDYFFVENRELCDGTNPTVIENQECLIPMSTFWEGSFERDQGEVIEAKVIAKNSLGSSEPSSYN